MIVQFKSVWFPSTIYCNGCYLEKFQIHSDDLIPRPANPAFDNPASTVYSGIRIIQRNMTRDQVNYWVHQTQRVKWSAYNIESLFHKYHVGRKYNSSAFIIIVFQAVFMIWSWFTNRKRLFHEDWSTPVTGASSTLYPFLYIWMWCICRKIYYIYCELRPT